jgi:hypothetical protein
MFLEGSDHRIRWHEIFCIVNANLSGVVERPENKSSKLALVNASERKKIAKAPGIELGALYLTRLVVFLHLKIFFLIVKYFIPIFPQLIISRAQVAIPVMA